MTDITLLSPLPTPDEMRRWDNAAVALGLPELLLMENAAREALTVLLRHAGTLEGAKVLLFMGGGNNGGDAACLARHIQDAGGRSLVLHTHPLRAAKGAAGQHVRVARACGVPFMRLPTALKPESVLPLSLPVDWREPDIIVDGLLGTGFSGPLRPPLAAIIAHINAHARRCRPPFILALDVPSGCDACTGRPCPDAVRATATVCFAAAKPGLVLPHAQAYTGKLHVRGIGIPAQVQEASFRLLDKACARLLPHCPSEAHKNSFGHVLVLGGSNGLTGAAHLAARAALRAGAGLTSIASPAALSAEVKAGLPDIMTVPLAPAPFAAGTAVDNAHTDASIDWPAVPPENLLHAVSRASALVLGPGMGRSPAATALLEALLRLPRRPPAVLDADALNTLSAHPRLLGLLGHADICTPHPGEAARLLGVQPSTVQEERETALRALAALAPCLWVLKGAGTLLTRGQGPVLVAPYDLPTLAVAGSGDVLAGCAGAFLARGLDALPAAALAVGTHIRGGDLLRQTFPLRGGMATDLADILPRALASLEDLPEVIC